MIPEEDHTNEASAVGLVTGSEPLPPVIAFLRSKSHRLLLAHSQDGKCIFSEPMPGWVGFLPAMILISIF